MQSDGYDFGASAASELFNFTKGVQRHVYLALVERVKLWTSVADGDASHSEPRSKDNARCRAVNPPRLPVPDGKERLRDESDDKNLRGPRAGKRNGGATSRVIFTSVVPISLIGFSAV